ncbi:MAG: hypothetical protein QM734_12890 [Cyclobacteriaceae bacterium]
MKNLPAYSISILLVVASARTGLAQTRPSRSSRRSYEYDEQNSGQFPQRRLHLFKKKKLHSKNAKLKESKAQNQTEESMPPIVKVKRSPASDLENNFYGGFLFGVGATHFSFDQTTQVNFNYSQSNTSQNYQGGFDSNLSTSYPELKFGMEAGNTNGFFGQLILAGMATDVPFLMSEDFTLGKHFITHDNRWRISPSISSEVW